jgi:methionyl-tRNA formyltransferase
MLKICFVGNVEFSWHVLDEILKRGFPIQAVFQIDAALAGDISDYRSTEELAKAHDVPFRTFKNINDIAPLLQKCSPDVALLFGASQVVKPEVLAIPRLGWIGTHPALLPRNRGRASIPWSILNGDTEGGLSFFMLGEKVDSGDVLVQKQWDIDEQDTATTLYQKMITAGRERVRYILAYFKNDMFPPRFPQDNLRATYTKRRTPEDGCIHWDTMTAAEIHRLIRATTHPYPGAFSYLRGVKVIFWKADLVKHDHPGDSGEIIQIVRLNPWRVAIAAKNGVVVVTLIQPISQLPELHVGDKFNEMN